MKQREKIIKNIGEIPAIPVSASKAVSLLQDPNRSLPEIIKVIEYDPGITANILKLANSSVYSTGREISSLRDATIRLGASNILQLLISSSFSSIMKTQVKGYDLPSGELWKSSITTAICTDIIKSTLRIELPSYTFTAALLHDIGKIILGSFIDVNASEIIECAVKGNLSFEEAENIILGIDHAEVGAILMEKWNLPEELEKPVRWHHTPEKSENFAMVTGVVHIADALTMMKGVGAGKEGLNYRFSNKVADELGLNINLIETIVFRTQCRYEDLKDTFSS
ncbi:MAG: hypothetical protein A2017_15575 [Lentisphaerae bacterium GWF2_44_16]|nr:MAG: hypothetical protein A2017_15575 [Lentisphaerae bacterium GWF2_44_16]